MRIEASRAPKGGRGRRSQLSRLERLTAVESIRVKVGRETTSGDEQQRRQQRLALELVGLGLALELGHALVEQQREETCLRRKWAGTSRTNRRSVRERDRVPEVQGD